MTKNLIDELAVYLDGQTITQDNIGPIRRACCVPWDSEWNAHVREETAKRELAPAWTPLDDLPSREQEQMERLSGRGMHGGPC